MSKFIYKRERLYLDPNPLMPSKVYGNSKTRIYQVSLPNLPTYCTLSTWVGGCGLAFIEGLGNIAYYNTGNTKPNSIAPIISYVEDVMRDITQHHAELQLNDEWPVKDVYFTLAMISDNFKIGENYGEFTKLINIFYNKAHGPNSIFTFHSSHP